MTTPQLFSAILALALSPLLAASADDIKVAGKWKATTVLPNDDERESVVVLTEKEGKWTGTAKGQSGERELKKVSVDEAKVVFELDILVNGNDLVFRVDANVEEANRLRGTWTATGTDGAEVASGAWKAQRDVPRLVGEWAVTALDPDKKELKFPITVSEAEGKLAAVFKMGEHALSADEVSLEDKKATFKIKFPFDGQAYPLTVTATLLEDQLDGKWVAFNEAGAEEATGAWKAVRAGAAELALDGKDLVVDMELPYDGSTIELRVKAAFGEANVITGKWIAFDDSGQESSSGDWKAARKTES